MLRDVLARATPASINDTSIGVYARLRPGAEADTEVEVKRKAGEQRHVQVRSEAFTRHRCTWTVGVTVAPDVTVARRLFALRGRLVIEAASTSPCTNQVRNLEFSLDWVFDERAPQQDVFDRVAKAPALASPRLASPRLSPHTLISPGARGARARGIQRVHPRIRADRLGQDAYHVRTRRGALGRLREGKSRGRVGVRGMSAV